MAILPLFVERAVTILDSVLFEEVNNFLGLVLTSIIHHDYEQSMRFAEIRNVTIPLALRISSFVFRSSSQLYPVQPSVIISA